jgi:hypothetical protein
LLLAVAGQPLHTRSLTLELDAREDGRLRLRGTILDLRKHGVLPMPGELQTAGIIHHMWLELALEPRTRELAAVEAGQPAVAFEPSPATGGECCRDPVQRLRALVGRRLDGEFATALRREIGGPRGCSHLLTLFQLSASAAARALDLEQAAGGAEGSAGRGAQREAGESVFKRSLLLDGLLAPAGAIEMAIHLSDFHTAPRARTLRPPDRLARHDEVRVLARVEMEGPRLAGLRAGARSRTPGDPGAWRDLARELEGLAGLPLLGGLGAELVRRLGARPELRLLLDALLNVAPGFIQCAPPLLDPIFAGAGGGARAASAASALGIGGLPDSCYMWRRDGVLAGARGRLPG